MYEAAFRNIDDKLWKDAGCSSAVDFNKVVRSIMQLSKNAPAVDQFVLTD